MIRYIAARLGQALFVIWAAFTLGFLLLYVMPSDPALIIANQGQGEGGGNVSPADLQVLRHQLGLDKPLILQYLTALVNAVTLNWGTSYQTKQTVLPLITGALGPTAQLALGALLIALVIGLLLGFAGTYFRRGKIRALLLSLPSFGASLPTFWTGLVLIQLFSFAIPLFPAFGNKGWQSNVLPSLALAIPAGAIIAQVFARSMRTELAEQYIDTARARGATRFRIQYVHAARNAVLPVLAMFGMLLGTLLAGSVVTETVFARQGFGRITVTAVDQQDLPVILGVIIICASVFAFANLAVDLLFPLINPRLADRRQRSRALTAETIHA